MTAALELASVTYVVTDGSRQRTVLDHVSLTVSHGEFVAVMGPSGAGKSTLLHLCCGLLEPSTGHVLVHGLQPSRSKRAWWAEQRRHTIGFVHQRLNLLAGLSAAANVALALELDGIPRRAARQSAAEALDALGVADLASTPASRLSIGEQQRVAIARAIAGGRPLVLADEPAAALDRTSAEHVARLLGDVARAGRAVLMVTHDSEQASWADHTIVLRDGRVVDRIGSGLVGASLAGESDR